MSHKKITILGLAAFFALFLLFNLNRASGPGPLGGPLEAKTAGEVRNDNQLQMSFVWIPSGDGVMGCSLDEPDRFDTDDPLEKVSLVQGYWLGKFEVMQGEWFSIMRTRPWRNQLFRHEDRNGDRIPATFVDWDESMEFCRRLTDKERAAGRLPSGWKYTLPTELQWEIACRAGTKTCYSFGNDPSKLTEYAWIEENSAKKGERYPHPVGRKKANPWGLFDIHGNVLEWCEDEVVSDNPTEPDKAILAQGMSGRIFKGGCWTFPPTNARAGTRSSNWNNRQSEYLGFRVALVRNSERKPASK